MGNAPVKLKDSLHRLLQREMSLYRDLLGLLRREQESLLRHSLSDLSETNRLKKALIFDLQETENERELIVADLAEIFGIPPKNATLSKVGALLERRESAALLDCGSQLLSVLSLCQDIGRENKVMLRHSFELVGSLVAGLAGPESTHFTYLPTGEVKAEAGAGRLVERQA